MCLNFENDNYEWQWYSIKWKWILWLALSSMIIIKNITIVTLHCCLVEYFTRESSMHILGYSNVDQFNFFLAWLWERCCLYILIVLAVSIKITTLSWEPFQRKWDFCSVAYSNLMYYNRCEHEWVCIRPTRYSLKWSLNTALANNNLHC